MLKHYLLVLLIAMSGHIILAKAQTSVAAPALGLTADDFTHQIEDFLQDRAAVYPGEARILVKPPQIDRMPACQESEIFLSGNAQLRSRISVGMRCLLPQPWVSYTQADISIEGSYYVSSHSLDAGTVITNDDIATREGDLLRLSAGAFYEADRLVGSITTQRIGTGTVIRERMLRSADSIVRGQALKLEARGKGFVASSDGTALQSGEPGTQIQVRTASGQTVTGTVLNGHTVLVLM